MMYILYLLSLRPVEDMLCEQGTNICDEAIQFWWNWFGSLFLAKDKETPGSQCCADRLKAGHIRSYRAAMEMIDNTNDQARGWWINNRAEN
jgi:hypothetical protein